MVVASIERHALVSEVQYLIEVDDKRVVRGGSHLYLFLHVGTACSGVPSFDLMFLVLDFNAETRGLGGAWRCVGVVATTTRRIVQRFLQTPTSGMETSVAHDPAM